MIGAKPPRGHLLDHDAAPAITMTVGVVVALGWSLVAPSNYERIINIGWTNRLSRDFGLGSPHDVAASILMTIFFFGVGLELARERRRGALAHPRHAAAPILAAIGGMVATALLAVVTGLLTHTPALRHGWGIPMATDIAFTLGILSLVGRGLPPTLRVFLLSLAVADDVLSVVALAVTGAASVRLVGLVVALAVSVAGFALARRHASLTRRLMILGGLWIGLTVANVEPALAGVIAGLLAPYDDVIAPRLERATSRWSVSTVLPLYALVSCGISWNQLRWRGDTITIVIAMIAIRVVGKVVGISAGVALARRLRLPTPASLTGPLLRAGAVLCAIGFTVPLLFARALFATSSGTYGAFTLGLVSASAIAAVVGGLLLRRVARSR